MSEIITEVIPTYQQFYSQEGTKEIDFKAICIFAALGFFLESDTYFTNKKVLQPGSIYQLDDYGRVISQQYYFEWVYKPREITLDKAVEEFHHIFSGLIQPYKNKELKIILPLSGGLDSRTQAASLLNYQKVFSYSYAFKGGHDESGYGRKISKILNFPFREYRITEGYLWEKINELAKINNSYSDFTHPRQMAVVDDMPYMGDLFYLGHWGDVLFDNYGISDKMSSDQQIDYLAKKLVKKGGLELASDLWSHWVGSGDFELYLKQRLVSLWDKIKIDELNAKFRAFKSLYWAPRWTSVNLSIFEKQHPIFLPYYSKEMCEFITTVPELLLANRKIQIEYIKKYCPAIAAVEWQDVTPLNLYNFHRYNSPNEFIRRNINKISRRLSSEKIIQRNWELQFLGIDNEIQLLEHLNNPSSKLIPTFIIDKYFNLFKNKDSIKYSHPISMLLTLSKVTFD